MENVIARKPRGTFCGVATLPAHGAVNVYILKGQFTISKADNFIGYIKTSLLRKFGIFDRFEYTNRKKLFGQHGYIGTRPKAKQL